MISYGQPMYTTEMCDSIINYVLNKDQACRTDKELMNDDLITLGDLAAKEWDFSLPTLANRGMQKAEIPTPVEFKARLTKTCPAFDDTFPWDNVLMAGGAVSGILTDSNSFNDVDLFIYGLDREAANAKVQQICNYMYDHIRRERVKFDLSGSRSLHSHKAQSRTPYHLPTLDQLNAKLDNYNEDITFIRNKYTLTIKDDCYRSDNKLTQIIFRLYSSASEILHGFDIGSAAVGYDGANVLFTTLSQFAYEYRANILDTTRRSTSYEFRLRKYFDRQFDIVLPHFDISKLKGQIDQNKELGTPIICKLPLFACVLRKVIGNRMNTSQFYGRKVHSFISDYEDIECENYKHSQIEYSALYRNIKKLLENKPDEFTYWSATPDKALKNTSSFGAGKISYFYSRIKRHLEDTSSFPTKIVEMYLAPVPVEEVFMARNDEAKINGIIGSVVTELMEKVKEQSEKDLEQHWITENPGTQLTSSINPIMEEPQKWYGKYFKEWTFEPTD